MGQASSGLQRRRSGKAQDVGVDRWREFGTRSRSISYKETVYSNAQNGQLFASWGSRRQRGGEKRRRRDEEMTRMAVRQRLDPTDPLPFRFVENWIGLSGCQVRRQTGRG